MEKVITEIQKSNKNLNLAEVSGLLYLVVNGNGADLVGKTGLPKETIKAFKSSIANYIEEKEDSIILNSRGKDLLKDTELRPYKWSLSDTYEFDTNVVKEFTSIREKYNLNAKRDLDQFFALPEISLKKAQVMIDKGCVDGNKIAILGDDDLVSIALALLNSNYDGIYVFETDPDLLAYISATANRLGLKNIYTIKYDCRDELLTEHLGKYDVVTTDPPYTQSGIRLFLDRALSLVGPTSELPGNFVFLYYGNSFKSPEKFLKIQEIINQSGLVLEERAAKFARYSGAESIGSASSLYVLKTNPHSHLVPIVNDFSKLYTYDVQKEEKFPFVDHVVIKATGIDQKLLLNKKVFLSIAHKFCDAHKLKMVDQLVTQFKNGGLSVTFILSTSNLVVHTWPELGALHLDLITCSPIYKKNELLSTVSDLFETKLVESFLVD